MHLSMQEIETQFHQTILQIGILVALIIRIIELHYYVLMYLELDKMEFQIQSILIWIHQYPCQHQIHYTFALIFMHQIGIVQLQLSIRKSSSDFDF